MEWLTQNWIWIAVLLGVASFLGFRGFGHGGHRGGFGSAGHGGHGGCCGGHSKEPASDKPDVTHGHQH